MLQDGHSITQPSSLMFDGENVQKNYREVHYVPPSIIIRSLRSFWLTSKAGSRIKTIWTDHVMSWIVDLALGLSLSQCLLICFRSFMPQEIEKEINYPSRTKLHPCQSIQHGAHRYSSASPLSWCYKAVSNEIFQACSVETGVKQNQHCWKSCQAWNLHSLQSNSCNFTLMLDNALGKQFLCPTICNHEWSCKISLDGSLFLIISECFHAA